MSLFFDSGRKIVSSTKFTFAGNDESEGETPVLSVLQPSAFNSEMFRLTARWPNLGDRMKLTGGVPTLERTSLRTALLLTPTEQRPTRLAIAHNYKSKQKNNLSLGK
mmetsp:Transcript_14336/g.18827  ORF Transcript_14336/g.18827 Transcript_14336/m.18827 type:complete len:107 (-) Transcript_14336:74-394(-)